MITLYHSVIRTLSASTPSNRSLSEENEDPNFLRKLLQAHEVWSRGHSPFHFPGLEQPLSWHRTPVLCPRSSLWPNVILASDWVLNDVKNQSVL